jgi:hypothetical protein
MRSIPFISLAVAVVFAFVAWKRRREFATRPYFHWFIYLHLAAVGLHQFEEYGWPGGFRDTFAAVFNIDAAGSLVPSTASLEILNAFGFTVIFGLVGWFGTRVPWVGLGLLFVNFGNGFFHLVYSMTQMGYIPGVVTGTVLYMPLGLLAARHAVRNNDVDGPRLVLAFALGTITSFLPFIHVWTAYALRN